MVAHAQLLACALLATLLAGPTAGSASRPRHIFFMRGPTSPSLPNMTWRMLQQDPETSFTEQHLREMIRLLGADNFTSGAVKVGVTFQWELLDCFLSPHDCTPEQVAEGVTNFLSSAATTRIPVEITLDPAQFYYATGLWNWFDPLQPNYDPKNVQNVEWTGWDASSATKIAWRDWGKQFRMPTPQPNWASPALLNATSSALHKVIGAIREWWEKSPVEDRKLLVGIKLGEEVDVGANYFYYANGNSLLNESSAMDPTHGPDWSKGLFGGLPAMGYNMLQTRGVRSEGAPPTRDEITDGIRAYFSHIIKACTDAWPELHTNDLLVAHAGHVEDPLLARWDAPMVAPAVPGYTFYFGPGKFPGPGRPSPVGQPGLRKALKTYYGKDEPRYVVAESACFGCSTADEWVAYFTAIFSSSSNPYGRVDYMRYYNIAPFVQAPGAIEGLRRFVATYRYD